MTTSIGEYLRSGFEAKQARKLAKTKTAPLSLKDSAQPEKTPAMTTASSVRPRSTHNMAASENATIIPSSKAVRE